MPIGIVDVIVILLATIGLLKALIVYPTVTQGAVTDLDVIKAQVPLWELIMSAKSDAEAEAEEATASASRSDAQARGQTLCDDLRSLSSRSP